MMGIGKRGLMLSIISAMGISGIGGHDIPYTREPLMMNRSASIAHDRGGKTGSRPFRPRSQKKRRIHMRQQGAYR